MHPLTSAKIGAPLPAAAPNQADVESAQELRDAFGKFVGQSVFSQMLASMRQTVGKPAYFHGGQGEEVFRGQLDQVLSEKMAASGDGSLAERMFQQQFPRQAETLRAAEASPALTSLQDLRRW